MNAVTPAMSAALRARVEELTDRFAVIQAEAERVRLRVRDLTATAADDGLSVTVTAAGRLTALEVDGRAYRRLSPSELAAAVLRLSDRAAEDARREVAELLRPLLPPGADLEGLIDGTADSSALVGDLGAVAGWEPVGPVAPSGDRD